MGAVLQDIYIYIYTAGSWLFQTGDFVEEKLRGLP